MKKRFKHDLSTYRLQTMAAGALHVLDCTEVLGNTTCYGNTEGLLRTLPLNSPVMHPLHMEIMHFFVPTRLIWSEWEKFITNGEYGSTPPVHPTMTVSYMTAGEGSLLNELGLKALHNPDAGVVINPLPLRAYQKIMNDYFIDQDLTTPVALSTASGADSTTSTNLFISAWKKDYFTTARPWPQKGAAVSIPQANVVSNGESILINNGAGSGDRNIEFGGSSLNYSGVGTSGDAEFGDETGLELDDTATIDDLNLAGALQKFLRNRAKEGSRYIEYLKNAFGATVQDSRLQRSELISRGRKTIQFSEVLQTAEGTNPVGTLRGRGVSGMSTNKFKYYCPEHGYVLTLARVLPEPIYMDASPRFFFKDALTDYYQREFDNIGQQPIWEAEVNVSNVPSGNKKTWAFQDPYDDYRTKISKVCGLMLSTYNTWHMARGSNGTSMPALNDAFIRELPTKRIYAIDSYDNLQIMAYNKLIVRSVVPKRRREPVF